MLLLDVKETTSIILWVEIRLLLLTKNNPMLVLVKLTQENHLLQVVLDMVHNLQVLPQSRKKLLDQEWAEPALLLSRPKMIKLLTSK